MKRTCLNTITDSSSKINTCFTEGSCAGKTKYNPPTAAGTPCRDTCPERRCGSRGCGCVHSSTAARDRHRAGPGSPGIHSRDTSAGSAERRASSYPRRFERRLEPADLAQHDLPVVRLAPGLLIKPAARAADGIIAVEIAVIIEDIHGVHIVRRKKAVSLFRGAPPEVVVALEQDLFPRQRLDKLKVRQRLLHGHAPGKIAAEHADIVVMQGRKAKFDFST